MSMKLTAAVRPLEVPAGRRPAHLAPVEDALLSPRPHASGPRPRVDGKFLAVGAERLWLAGVTYGTFAPGEDGAPYGERAQVEADFRAMAQNGINALRTYTVPPRWLLDAALRHGLWVTVGLPWEQHVTFLDSRRRAAAIETRIRAGVAACAGHPAVLGYLVGNEIPASIVRWHGRGKVERFVERLRNAAKQEDSDALISYASFPSTEYLELPQLDVVSYNVYLEDPERLEAYLARLQNLAGERPLVMTELGLDSCRHGRTQQARALREQIRTSFAGGCAGTYLFAWTDEWHTGGAEVTDWDFGLVDRARQPKPALASARSAYADLPLGASGARADANTRPPRISVIVCTLNGAATIGETLAAIARLEYPDVEAIVVDDGSTDVTAEIVVAHPQVRLIRTPNRGLSAARNTGLRAATGEVVAYLDDDAYPDPHWLDYVAHALREGTHAGVGGPNLPVPRDGLVAESVANAPGGPVHVLLSDTVAEHIPGCNMVFRRDRLEAIGGFDEQFRVAGDDVDVCWRLQERGWTLGFHSAAVVWHHRRGSVRGFWRQQRGYGRAEALLERAWPEKYNTPGHLAWGGRIYGRGSAALRRSRVYYGQFGSSAFQQKIEQPVPQPLLLALAGTPEWWLVVAALAVISALGAIAHPLLVALPMLAGALALPLWQALATARRCDVRDRPLPTRLAGSALTAFLVLLGPAARLVGRTQGGLTPWRRGCRRGFRLPRVRVVSSWHERWRPLTERVTALEAALRAGGLRVRRADGCERWELHTAAGAFGGVRLRAAVEEHGRGRQLVRVRVHPHLPRLGRWALGGPAACALVAALFAEWATAAVASAPLALLLACATFECGAATAVALRAVHAMEERA